MADPSHDRVSREGIPRWLKVSGIVLLLVAALAVVLMLAIGGGGHGPRPHGLGYGPAEQLGRPWR